MTLHLHWFLPSHGDGRELADRDGRPAGRRRAPDPGYLEQVARAAEDAGFSSVLVPFGLFCEDPWLVSAALARSTTKLKFMVAMRPGMCSPLLTAQMSATLQRVTDGRLMLNIVAGGDPAEQKRYGDEATHSSRYARSRAFLDVLHRLWTGERVTTRNDYFEMEEAFLHRPPPSRPTVFLGGSSAEAGEVANELADVLLQWGESPQQLADAFAQRATTDRRPGLGPLEFGTRFHIIGREEASDAWRVADALVSTLSPARIRQAQELFRRSDSVGQQRAAALHGGRADRLEVAPNVWAGYGLVRPGSAAALVGNYGQVAERIRDLHRAGAQHLILSANPHLEEAIGFGENIRPLLEADGTIPVAA